MPRRTPERALENLRQLVKERDRIERLLEDNVRAALAYDLEGHRELTTEQVAEVLGVSRQNVNQRWGPFPKVLGR